MLGPPLDALRQMQAQSAGLTPQALPTDRSRGIDNRALMQRKATQGGYKGVPAKCGRMSLPRLKQADVGCVDHGTACGRMQMHSKWNYA